ncbi:MAG: hypothetical protein AAB869_00035 [Patescibacteria group bacterium]
MSIFRNTIRRSSRRERLRRIDRVFEIILKFFLVCYFLFVFSAWLSYRPSFRISEIWIEDTQAVDTLPVRSVVESELASRLLWKIDRNNIVFYPRRKMYSAIMALDTRIKGVTMNVESMKRFTVHISEYSPAFLWCPTPAGFEGASTFDAKGVATSTTGCSFADETGRIFAPAPEYSGNPFIIFMTTVSEESRNKSAVLPREEFDKMNLFLRKLAMLGFSPRIVRQSGPHDFTLFTNMPWVIRWSSARDPEEDARNLALVLQNLSGDNFNTDALKAIDLRFGNKVFYR